jgi:type I restriction enzyme, R subunit
MQSPEAHARAVIDAMLRQAGWAVQGAQHAKVSVAHGIAIREFSLKAGRGFSNYLLFADASAAGIIEAKKAATTLTGIEIQSQQYSEALPDHLVAPVHPLPFRHQSTRIETRFTCGLNPKLRSLCVFHVHRPDPLTAWIAPAPDHTPAAPDSTLRARLRQLPPLITSGLQPVQHHAVQDIGHSLMGAASEDLHRHHGHSALHRRALWHRSGPCS